MATEFSISSCIGEQNASVSTEKIAKRMQISMGAQCLHNFHRECWSPQALTGGGVCVPRGTLGITMDTNIRYRIR